MSELLRIAFIASSLVGLGTENLSCISWSIRCASRVGRIAIFDPQAKASKGLLEALGK